MSQLRADAQKLEPEIIANRCPNRTLKADVLLAGQHMRKPQATRNYGQRDLGMP
jgi:hypothetical protein